MPQLNPISVVAFSYKLKNLKIFDKIQENVIEFKLKHYRNPQTQQLLDKLSKALIPLNDTQIEWLNNRSITNHSNVYGLDLSDLSKQDLLDSFIIPLDHVTEHYGVRPIKGIAFPDIRNGELHGLCIRNLSKDLPFVAAAKYTFSNFGQYLYGYDEIAKDDEIAICEGVFDVKALNSINQKAIGIGAAHPTTWQLACIQHKTKNIKIYMDNDFQGWCGAYAIAKCFNKDHVFIPDNKDPAEEILEFKTNSFNKTSLEKLEKMIISEIPIYNEKIKGYEIKSLHEHRNLRYN